MKKISKTVVEKLINEPTIFSKYNCQLFSLSKKKITSIKSLLGSLNNIFENYGFKIISVSKKQRNYAKIISSTHYLIILDQKFKQFI